MLLPSHFSPLSKSAGILRAWSTLDRQPDNFRIYFTEIYHPALNPWNIFFFDGGPQEQTAHTLFLAKMGCMRFFPIYPCRIAERCFIKDFLSKNHTKSIKFLFLCLHFLKIIPNRSCDQMLSWTSEKIRRENK